MPELLGPLTAEGRGPSAALNEAIARHNELMKTLAPILAAASRRAPSA